MKKLPLTLLLLFSIVLTVKAQHYEMAFAPDTILYNPNGSDIAARSYLKNISGNTDSIHVKRIQNELAPGHKTSFVWGSIAYAPTVNSSDIADIYVTLDDQRTDSTFQLLLFPDFNGGTTQVTMRFYSRSDTSKYMDHTYVFVPEVAASISHSDVGHGFILGNPYPNPTQGLLHLKYQLPNDTKQAQVQLINLEGKQVYTQSIYPGESQVGLQLDQIPAGMYFLYLMHEGRRVAQTRCVVYHP